MKRAISLYWTPPKDKNGFKILGVAVDGRQLTGKGEIEGGRERCGKSASCLSLSFCPTQV